MDEEAYWDSLLDEEDDLLQMEMDLAQCNVRESPPPKTENQEKELPIEKEPLQPYSRTLFRDLTDFLPITANNEHVYGEQFYVRLRPEPPNKALELTSEFSSNFDSIVALDHCSKKIESEHISTPSSSSLFKSNEQDLTPSFTYLLSDPAINRQLLKWIKQWDDCVFRSKRSRRPEPMIALLHGPPGSGKTTLVRSLAKHAGYEVVEVNASDERTIDSIANYLESSSFKSILTEACKPKLLLFDEIDGTPEPAIKYISEIARNRKNKTIYGPVVCVANHIHGVSGFDLLRKCRLCAIFAIPHANPDRLATNLCSYFDLESHLHDAISYMANRTNCDIRACMQSLRLILPTLSSEKNDRYGMQLTRETIDKLGVKDHQSCGLFDAWKSVLYGKDHECVDWNQYIQCCNDQQEFQLLINGIYENFVVALHSSTSFNEDRLVKACKILQWISMANIDCPIFLRVYIGLAIKLILGSRSALNANRRYMLTFPKNRVNLLLKIDKEFKENFKLRTACVSNRSLIMEYVPYLWTIVQPSCLRGISSNRQQLSRDRVHELERTVRLMMTYGIDYVEQDGIYRLNHDTLTHRLSKFFDDSMNKDGIYQISNALRLAVHREIHEEKVRNCGGLTTKSKREWHAFKTQTEQQVKKISSRKVNKIDLDDFVQSSSCKKRRMEDDDKNKSAQNMKMSPISFRFKKGFCNGVKYKSYVRDWI